jgi:uncharacterized OB-fold protein/acyl dehydratase
MSQDKKAELEKKLHEYVGIQQGPPVTGADAVNEAMIRHWAQALGDGNPAYTDPAAAAASIHGSIVAPPTMLQAWILPGMEMAQPGTGPKDKQGELHALLSEYGYTGVVATDCQQGYDRYLVPGDQVTATTTIESISEEKATALGIGYFINTRTLFTDQKGEPVGWMTFRVLKFKPSQPPQAASSLRAHDNDWWWEAIENGELRIQKCSECGTLRHPPRPMCGKCQSLKWESIRSSGAGTIYSYVVMHHPPIPGYEYPLPVALVELEEGTRIVSNMIECDLSELHIGMRVQASIEQVEGGMKLPLFRPVR